jgi:hypothetical protein
VCRYAMSSMQASGQPYLTVASKRVAFSICYEDFQWWPNWRLLIERVQPSLPKRQDDHRQRWWSDRFVGTIHALGTCEKFPYMREHPTFDIAKQSVDLSLVVKH